MNPRIRSMIDEIFSGMKMTAENLALRDELLSNAQARYEDVMSQGKSEEEAFGEVAASLEDVYDLLEELGGEKAEPQEKADEKKEAEGGAQMDLSGTLNKAFTALGDFSQAVMPEAKKLYHQMDGATGGVLGKLGRVAKKSMRDAQKAAGEAIDKLSKENGELVFDFGANKEAAPEESAEGESAAPVSDFAEEKAPDVQPEPDEEMAQPETEPDVTDETAMDDFAQAMDELAREAQAVADQMETEPEQEALHQEEAIEQEPEYVVRDAHEPVSGMKRFPAAGLRRIDIQLDADDVEITACEGMQVETLWEAQSVDGEPVITCEGHALTIRRKNPDAFKTFFSVFKKEGGRITVRVPRGYAADYMISTTSGDVRIADVDVDNVKITTTSGCVCVAPDAATRAADLSVTTVSGRATVSASADTVAVTTVSGGQMISCDAKKVNISVVSGQVQAQGACDEWEASVVSGDVELRCTSVPAKKVKISSVHADVRLALPGEIRGFIAEATGALGCEIVNEFGPNRYGTCALPIRMDSMRGKLIITKL